MFTGITDLLKSLSSMGLNMNGVGDEEVVSKSRKRRSKWDIWVDNFNRLPRPVMIGMVIGMFMWSVRWADGDFLKWAKAMKELPDWLTQLITLFVIIIWGVKKIREDLSSKMTTTVKKVSASSATSTSDDDDDPKPAGNG